VWAAREPKIGDATVVQAESSTVRQPVLVELFTSEGCSDCPPADALLERLETTQFVPGAQAIVLSEHVTYWNYLGWTDPFSFEEMSERQSRYAAHFRLDSVYTPQAVVDGAAQVLGSDPSAISHAISAAAQRTKPDFRIEGAHWTGNTIAIDLNAPEGLNGALTVALAEDETHSSVSRGENAGRALHHVAVVRVMKTMVWNKMDGHPVTLDLAGVKGFSGHDFRLVAFVADGTPGRVLAVAERQITRP
jgi:hypothetical protein